MIDNNRHGGWIIFWSFVIALILTAMPLPEWATNWRPMWVAMVLIYWCMALPERIGIGLGWVTGLLLDVLQGTLLGQSALGLAILAFFIQKTHQRLRVSPLTQQALLVCIFVLFYLVLSLWVRGIMGVPPRSWTFWMPAFTSMLLWPWLFIILRDIRRKYHVT
ncbi:MAG: rod shape-determining protein MreD [Gammaproteobacteria bacterium]